jgi:hypothetical protein
MTLMEGNAAQQQRTKKSASIEHKIDLILL